MIRAMLPRTTKVRRKQHEAETPGLPLSSTEQILTLQQTVGNQGVQRLLAQGQLGAPPRPKLSRIARQEAVAEADEAVTFTRFEREHKLLRMGATGDEVVFLQRRLNLYGAKLVEDGIWGPLTQSAVTAFQQAHGLAADGVVGPLTWNALEKDPPNVTPPVSANASIDPLHPERTSAGDFQNFVDQGVLSLTVAVILQDMQSLPGFGAEMAKFAHQELSSGKLVAFVRGTESDKVKSKLHSKHHALLADDVAELAKPSINAVTRGVIGESRSYILFKDGQLDNAAINQPVRDVAILEISHELTHHRSRADFDRQASPAESPTSKDARDFFVDVKRAKKFQNTEFVRATFIDEIVSRHVAFHVENDRKAEADKVQIQGGQLFKAALDLGRLFTPYNDNGYMKDLATNAPDLFRQQVGNWLGEAAKRNYHSDPAINTKIQAFVLGEFTGSLFNGFAEPGVSPAGLR